MKTNILILSAGSRCQLITYFKRKENGFNKVVATDCSKYAPSLYLSDSYYIVPRINAPNYLSTILEIIYEQNIGIILPLQEDELELISANRRIFEEKGIFVAVSEIDAIKTCRDKYALYKHLIKHGIDCIETYDYETDSNFISEMKMPVIAKPRYGAGSIGLLKIGTWPLLYEFAKDCGEDLIVQPYLEVEEYGVDAYIDFISNQVIAMFAKKKIRMRAGETEKSVSIIDVELFEIVKNTVKSLGLAGPIDVDVFRVNGKYYILEINPRFGGGYPHAYGCGINFPAMLYENANNRENTIEIANYKEDEVLLKFTDAIMKNEKNML